jgi:hypothetical protein
VKMCQFQMLPWSRETVAALYLWLTGSASGAVVRGTPAAPYPHDPNPPWYSRPSR